MTRLRARRPSAGSRQVHQDRRPFPVPALVAATAVVVFAVDQATKTWALRALDDGPVHLVWTLRLNLSFNSGAAFGIGEGLAPLIVAAGVVIVVVLLVGMGQAMGTGLAPAAGLGLVLGGALGNLGDRLLRDHGGAVIDFIDLQWWPVFNVADSAITCGALLLVVAGSRHQPDASDDDTIVTG